MALRNFYSNVQKLNSERNSPILESVAKQLLDSVLSAEEQAANKLSEDDYEDFVRDLLAVLDDCKVRLKRASQERG